MANFVKGIESLMESVAKLERFKHDFIEEFKDRVQVRTPVDTGKLMNGFYTWVEEDTIGLSNPVDYHDYVEEGTEKMSPVHMVRITASESQAIADKVSKK